MWKFLTQYARRATLESADNLVRFFFGCRFHKQMDMIGLNCQLQNCPILFLSDFLADVIQSLCHVTNQHLFAPLRYPDKVVTHLVDCVI